MLRLLLSTSLFFILLIQLSGQSPLPPIGSHPLWRVGWTTQTGNTGVDEFTYGQQYVHCDKKYVAVLLNGEEILYLRLTEDQAYYILDLQTCEDERLLYDYNTTTGIEVVARSFFSSAFDTLRVDFGEYYTEPILGNEGVVVNYDNTMNAHPNNSTSVWARGVGDLFHPFYPLFNNFQPTQEIFYRLHSLEVNHLTWYCANLPDAGCSANQVIYVDGSQTSGMQDGSSWANAYQRLETALDAANFGDVLWVADGTYSLMPDSDRYRSFVLRDGISIYGGFQGNENTFIERNPELYLTVLSGDIGVPIDSTDNTNHVLRIQDAYEYAVIDGVHIRNGNSREGTLGFPFTEKGGGVLIYAALPSDENTDILITDCSLNNNVAKDGGGLAFHPNYNVPTHLSITKTSIENNYADQIGGGLSIPEFTPAEIDLRIHDSRIVGNVCQAGFGGGISDFTGAGWIISHTLFENNVINNGEGGGISIYLRETDKNISFLCSDFINNTSTSNGGAMQIQHELGAIALQLSVEDCNFIENRSFAAAGGAFILASFAPMELDINIKKSHFTNNRSSDWGGAVIIRAEGGGGDSQFLVDECVFSGNRSADFIGGGIRFFVDTPNDGIVTNKVFYSHIQNSLFFDNRNAISHSAVAGESLLLDSIFNCTFVNNDLIPFSKNYTPFFNGVDYGNEMYFKNCIIWEPDLPLWQLFYNGDPDPDLWSTYFYELDHCIISTEICDLPGGEESCEQNINYFNLYPFFRDTANHDFSLSACSPAINTGEYYEGISLTDLDGALRIQEEIVDIGAYEGQSLQQNIDSLINSLDCYGEENGLIDISYTNAVFPVSYSLYQENSLVNISNEGNFNALQAGDYLLVMEDAANCL
ncbi:MAG: choice-of-anchor Q domain-containing protein, partial [Bacteroidota bacterium]